MSVSAVKKSNSRFFLQMLMLVKDVITHVTKLVII